jgi:hypothetical protein
VGVLLMYSVQVCDLTQEGVQTNVVLLHISNFVTLSQMQAKVFEADKTLHELCL